MIRTAHTVAVSDAVIANTVIEFLKHRPDESKVLIINEYKNNLNISAI